MSLDAFEFRVQLLRTIVPRPPASVSPHVQTANLDFHKWHRPGEPPHPVMVQKPVGYGLSPQPQLVFVPWLTSGLRLAKTGLVSCREHGWKINCRLWGVHPTTNRETYGLVRNRFQSGAGIIYETALDISVDEFDANVIAHLETLGDNC